MKIIGAPKRSNWIRWIDPRGKSTGSIGFLVNRLAGLGLTLYLFMHLIVLGKLAQGKESFDGFTAMAHNPIIVAGEVLVVFAVMLHGINGLRIALTGIGYNVGSQKRMLVVIFVIAIAIGLYFAFRMFGGAE
jgi:succinate dehydrogenase / fumarate reductase, cytochrome b subunit